MMTQDDAIVRRQIPRGIALRKLADVANLRGRTVYIAERSGSLSGPWVCLSAESFPVVDVFEQTILYVMVTTEPDFWAAELLGRPPVAKRVPVGFCVTVAL